MSGNLGRLFVFFVLSWAFQAKAAQFIPLGFLPGGSQISAASAVSFDGSTVVGGADDNRGHTVAFRWTQSGGMQGLVDTIDIYGSTAVNADGSVVVGTTSYPGSSQGFRWTAATGGQLLPQVNSTPIAGNAVGVSGDGSITVGAGTFNHANSGLYWVGIGNPSQITPATVTSAAGISNDGSAIVGTDTHFVNNAFQDQAFLQKNGVFQDLGFLNSTNRVSKATAVNRDGTVVVGTSHYNTVNNDNEAFRWTAAGGMQPLVGMLRPYGISGDGSLVVGSNGAVSSGIDAMIWDQSNGTRKLKDVLIDSYGLGTTLANWQLTYATGISGDGQVIVGYGIDPQDHFEAWAVLVPEPASIGLLATSMTLLLQRRRRESAS